MRITKISVKGLFGMFDHEIPLNPESRITIVHGPNGVGKTVTLQLVHSMFFGSGELLGRVPFTRLQIGFESGELAVVERATDGSTLFIIYDDGTGQDLEYMMIYLPDYDNPDAESIDLRNYTRSKIERDRFSDLRLSVTTQLIHTLRLQELLYDDYGLPTLDLWDVEDDAHESIVKYFPARFYNAITGEKAFVADLEVWQILKDLADAESQALKSEDELSGLDEDLRIKWLTSRRKHLNELRHEILKRGQNEQWFHEVLLFWRLVNERCLFKSLRLEGQTFKFVSDCGVDVPFSALSSGEQHLLFLYFHLLFDTWHDTLVMIDEPELSMNVVWQRNFLKDLQRIVELRKFDVLIATHSPQIIHDKWDWVVHLGEKVDD